MKQDHFDFENAYTEEMLNGDSRTKYARTSSSTYDDEQDNSRIVIIQDLEVKNLRFTKISLFTVDEFQRKKIGVYNLLNRQILRLIQTRTVNFGRQSLI